MHDLKIITNGRILTCDGDNRAGRYDLLIRNGRMAEISPAPGRFTSLTPHTQQIDAQGKLVLPGLVNAHFHSDSLILRSRTEGLPYNLWKQDLRFQECARKILQPAHHDDLRSLYLASYFGHLKSGTTCVGEFGPAVDGDGFRQIVQAIERTDVRSVFALQNWDQITEAKVLRTSRARFAISLGKEADFTVYSFENLTRAAREMKRTLLAHVGEEKEDVDCVRRNFQKGILPLLMTYHALPATAVLIHLNHLSEQEIDLIGETGMTPVVCPRSSAAKGTGYPAFRYLARPEMRLALGTDWGSMDMFAEMQFLARLPLLVSGIRTFSALELIRMATINGAHALGLSEEIGSIEAGKKADLLFLDLRDVRVPPLSESPSAQEIAHTVVHHLGVRHVSDVMIDGDFYIQNGQILTMAEEDILEGFRKAHEHFFPQPSSPPAVKDPYAAQFLKTPMFRFIPGGRSGVRDVEGFEAGTSQAPEESNDVAEKVSPANLQAPPQRSTKKVEPSSLPELSKDVRRVFGEDEDFS